MAVTLIKRNHQNLMQTPPERGRFASLAIGLMGRLISMKNWHIQIMFN